ncbi:MAG: hypothetical protein ACTH5D_05165 [Halomonas sp.]|uniref:hypothetical protein n=1 Tax=Halomonas sp. TaxID=1486246 RepID=UPI003F8F4450
MSANMRLIIENLHDQATLSASSQALPIAYTQRSGRSYVWRSTDTSQQIITATLPGPRPISGVVLYGHNLSGLGSVRVEYLLSGNVVYDSGEKIASELIPLGTWRVGIDPWGGQDLTELPRVQSTTWTAERIADSYRITLDNPDNADGYLQVERIFAGAAYSPVFNVSYGVSLEWQDFAEHQRTEGNSLRTIGEGSARLLTFNLDYLDRNDMAKLSRALLRVGKRQDIYVSTYPEWGGFLEAEHAFVARRKSNYGRTHNRVENWQSQIAFEEV